MFNSTQHPANLPNQPEIAAAIALLEAHPDYRVLRTLPPAETLVSQLPPVLPLHVAAIVDVETTGLCAGLDEVLELAVQRLRFDALGRIVEVGTARSWLQEPVDPLTPEITAITGLTDEMLAGQRIDTSAATSLIGSADVVIAHNAAFDRPFVDLLLPAVKDAAWACTMCEIDWRAHGFEGRALNHLVYQAGTSGYFFGGHRAATDVLALLNLLAHPIGDDGATILGKLVATSETPSIKVMAVGAAFDRKDALKRRGYRWDANRQHWWTTVSAADEARERAFLTECIYRPGQEPQVEPVTWHDRYRG
jgi:DNA polymerase-3 subunit epsilon